MGENELEIKAMFKKLTDKISSLEKQISDMSVPERLLDAKAMVKMGIPRAAVYNLFNRADFPTIHIGCRKFVRSSRLYEFLDTKGMTLHIDEEGA